MTYYSQPIIDHFYEIAPGDTVTIPAKTFDATHSLPAMVWSAERAPLYDTSSLTDPTNAVYISPTSGTPAGSDTTGTGTILKPYATVSKARTVIDAGKVPKFILCLTGNYRQLWGTTFSDQSTYVLGVKGAKNSQVWFDGSDFLTGGTWSQSGNVWTWSGTFSTGFTNANSYQVWLDGIPQIQTSNTSPSVGQFHVSGTTLKIGSTVNPNTKVIESSTRAQATGNIKKNGFYIGYVGFRRWAGTTLFPNGVQQQVDHVVLAYGAGSGYLLNTSSTSKLAITELVVTHGPGKSWTDDGESQNMSVSGMRVWGNNWLHDHNTSPNNSASLGGVKHWRTNGFRGSDMLFGWNVSNGEWFDGSAVGNPSDNNRTQRVTYWYNGGYGQTTEVGVTRELADVLCVGNGWMGFGNADGTRFSGVNAAKLYSCTSLDNVGAGAALYEDGREYGGPSVQSRALNPSVCGDSVDCEQMGAVLVRTKEATGAPKHTKPPFWGYCQSGAATIFQGNESSSTGCVQTQPIATADMFTHAKHGKNVYIDTTGSTTVAKVATPDAGATWKLSPAPNGSYLKGVTTSEQGGSCTKQAIKTLANMQSLGLDTGSVAVTTAGKQIGDYFPDAGDPGDPGGPAGSGSSYSWWGKTNIPSTSTAVPTYAPPDWVCDALGVAHGSTVVAGCRFAPVPVLIGTTVANVAPDVATLTTPADGDPITGNSVAVSAEGHDPNDGTNVTVELRADGNPIGAGVFLTHTAGNTFTGTLNSTLLSDGNHDLRARVTDTAGLWKASAKSTVTVSNAADSTPPSVTGLTLSDGQVIREPFTVQVTVTDSSNVGSVVGHVTFPDGTTLDVEFT